MKTRYGNSFTLPERVKSKRGNPQYYDVTFDLPFDEVASNIPEADITDSKGQPLYPSSAADIIMNAEVLLPQGEDMPLAKIIRRNVDSDGKVIEDYNNIPTLNTILYDVKFLDGVIKPYSANHISENIY